MKFLVLALCVCAASAAPYDFKSYQPVKQGFQGFQGFRQPVAAKTAYNAPQFVATAPVTAAKATYEAAKFVAAAPAVAAKSTYDAAKFAASPFVSASAVVADSPIVGAKSIYKAPQAVEIVPAVAAPFYEAAQVVTAAPAVATRTVYDNARVIAPKNVYGNEAEAAILRSESDVSAEGYNYAYETANGIAAQSSGALKSVGGSDILVSQGYYQYTAPDGTPVKFEYVADENGYQPRSDLLPVGPAIPEAILRSLEYLRTHAPKQEESYYSKSA